MKMAPTDALAPYGFSLFNFLFNLFNNFFPSPRTELRNLSEEEAEILEEPEVIDYSFFIQQD